MLFTTTSCGVYSLREGSIDPRVTSVSIGLFMNESGGGPPTLPQIFTEKLRLYYQQNSRLAVLSENGDWRLEGKIIGYQVVPVAPTSNQTQSAGLNRLTIQVSTVFVNTINEKDNFDQVFSFYADFQQDQSLSTVEDQLIDEILNQIILDIFTKTTSNW